MTVLVVDDLVDSRNAIKTVLKANGFANVLEAESGADALSLMESDGKIDLVLLDILMPGMDGGEVLDRMRSKPMLENIPVIMVTAVDDFASVFKFIERGADDYLIKPVDELLLLERVRAILVAISTGATAGGGQKSETTEKTPRAAGEEDPIISTVQHPSGGD